MERLKQRASYLDMVEVAGENHPALLKVERHLQIDASVRGRRGEETTCQGV
jgi:hypothetical protein